MSLSLHSKKKLCVVTTSRAEYGLLRPILRHAQKSDCIDLQLVVSGTHLLQSKGFTLQEIQNDRIPICAQVELFENNNAEISYASILGKGCEQFADVLARLQPDMVLILGDRFELPCVVFPAYLKGISIAHVCGGDLTLGAIDDSIRHAITKLSTFHFVTNEASERRVLQMGEERGRVFNVGHTAIDNLEEFQLLSKHDIEQNLNVKFQKKNILMTYHPVTYANDWGVGAFENILRALELIDDCGVFITRPNIDMGHEQINSRIDHFVSTHTNAWAFPSLGTLRYFSLMSHVDIVLGNSSSGLMEAPYFKKPTVDVGEREKGRTKGNSVISCADDLESIQTALTQAFHFNDFPITNPYGNGGAGEKIVSIVEQLIQTPIHRKKTFIEM